MDEETRQKAIEVDLVDLIGRVNKLDKGLYLADNSKAAHPSLSLTNKFFRMNPDLAKTYDQSKSSVLFTAEKLDKNELCIRKIEGAELLPEESHLIRPIGVCLSMKGETLVCPFRGTHGTGEIKHSLGSEHLMLETVSSHRAEPLSILTKDKSLGMVRGPTLKSYMQPQGDFPSLQQQFLSAAKGHKQLVGAGHSLGAAFIQIAAVDATVHGMKRTDAFLYGPLAAFNQGCKDWLANKPIKFHPHLAEGDPVPFIDTVIASQKMGERRGLALALHGDMDVAVFDHEEAGMKHKPLLASKRQEEFHGYHHGDIRRAQVKGIMAFGPLNHRLSVYQQGVEQRAFTPQKEEPGIIYLDIGQKEKPRV